MSTGPPRAGHWPTPASNQWSALSPELCHEDHRHPRRQQRHRPPGCPNPPRRGQPRRHSGSLPTKGKAALASFGTAANRASFRAADLSTHDGVRDAARRILDEHESLDALIHTTGVLTMQESRTADGLHLFFAVTYLSRYHLTQVLLPALRAAERPTGRHRSTGASPATSISTPRSHSILRSPSD
ncbi:SDR family NAD(P)-dependent oxidoreductase [Saccharopolyspora sp. HNM0983]|uniref:SDR family NAD(P)-dependent oxidoreductase n=1 Tax=Saccharopolyspora montiporae TaxID=2781240 RepID=A0A929G194_9PSEU|nr:SDR family NAD(P)-dependent oxidoreductase [Saccharopolyspora sp. HNM0983]